MDKKDVFALLKELIIEFQKMFEESEKISAVEWTEKYSASSDELYEKYWRCVHDNFDKEMLAAIEKRIDPGKFCTKEYFDALYNEYNHRPVTLCEYGGWSLVRAKDAFGATVVFVYEGGRQHSDAIDFIDEDEVVRRFKTIVDETPEDPYFDF